MAANFLDENSIESIYDEMQAVYLNDNRPWIIGYSGGKDSTVLADIVRNVCGYKNIPLVFVDVPTQYPELKQFAMTFDNLVILKPKISFAEVCEKYGFPLISKEISEKAMYSRKYLKKYLEINTITTDRQTDRQTDRRFHTHLR